MLALGRTADFKAALRSRRMLGMAALTAAMITFNWGIYVWAIAADRTVETALGYYINPLVNVVVGALLLGERLGKLQIVAVAAGGGRRHHSDHRTGQSALGIAVAGVFLRCLWLLPQDAADRAKPGLPARGYAAVGPGARLRHLAAGDRAGSFSDAAPRGDTALLLGCGPVTAVPLLLFAFGARLLRLSTIGLMQYIAPTIVFLIAVFVFDEPFGTVQAIAFGLIWAALAIYT